MTGETISYIKKNNNNVKTLQGFFSKFLFPFKVEWFSMKMFKFQTLLSMTSVQILEFYFVRGIVL